MQQNLTERVRHLVRDRGPITLAELEQVTGLHSSVLSRFARGQISTITADAAQRIYEHLTGNKLELH